jgi:tetratricopeptide (TPR) repeat protein
MYLSSLSNNDLLLRYNWKSTHRSLNNTQNAKKHTILVSTIQCLKNTQFNILDKKMTICMRKILKFCSRKNLNKNVYILCFFNTQNKTYINRAQALIYLNQYQQAIKDCDIVLQLDEKNVKALARRTLANRHSCNFYAALHDLKDLQTIQPTLKFVKPEIVLVL